MVHQFIAFGHGCGQVRVAVEHCPATLPRELLRDGEMLLRTHHPPEYFVMFSIPAAHTALQAEVTKSVLSFYKPFPCVFSNTLFAQSALFCTEIISLSDVFSCCSINSFAVNLT